MASNESPCWRNAANNPDLCLSKNGSDVNVGATPDGKSLAAHQRFAALRLEHDPRMHLLENGLAAYFERFGGAHPRLLVIA